MSVAILTRAPHISVVDPNSPRFRAVLAHAGQILVGMSLEGVFGAYSRHEHHPLRRGEVVFEERVTSDMLALYPLPEGEAVKNGLPSCWGIAPDGSVVVLRYADRRLHAESGVDVASVEFLAQLAKLGEAFAAAGLHELLEVNIAGRLFPSGDGTVTSEVTDETARFQEVTRAPTPDAIANGDWAEAACWRFGSTGEVAVTGICSGCP